MLLTGKKNLLCFLIDGGASVSAILATAQQKSKTPISFLYAANNTKIAVYGKVILELNVGLRRPILWEFFIADIDIPIIGIDLLYHHQLLVDPYNCRLIDDKTKLTIKCNFKNSPSLTLSTIPPPKDQFQELLEEFPKITGGPQLLFLPPVTTNIRHHILTKGPPITCRPRRLSPAMLKIARKEIQYLLQLGIIRPSSSPWASPLHMAPKGKAYRAVGDYRALNNLTIPDSCPLPHIHDFASSFAGCNIFSQIDLVRAFNQIYVAEEDVPKTAIATLSACSNLSVCL